MLQLSRPHCQCISRCCLQSSVDGSDSLATLQTFLGRLEAKEEEDEYEDDDTEEEEEEDSEDTDLDDWEPDTHPGPSTRMSYGVRSAITVPKARPLAPDPQLAGAHPCEGEPPLVLYIDRFLGAVFSKGCIPKHTQFGPMEGPLIRGSELKDCYIHLKVSLEKGDRKDRDLHEDLWFELSDETLCNWMMFVRLAQNHLEQNLVAYQ
ncbi:PR domain zinc finger protein 10 [Saguinus oedipus]|uniref:PR domain zinc finger protein 10 n=1 Tax=Saguinus oedipus TaxID=9490 RepID=A0ABQ9W541_SAGOE|nr:PR domain zinc finger protein 10 [Saguinus oedipus]